MTGNKGIATFLILCCVQWVSIAVADKQVTSEKKASEEKTEEKIIVAPHKEVERITNALLATFEKNFDKYKKNDVLFITEVDRQLSPVVAFSSMARGVMGKYSGRATKKQVDKFAIIFKESLISFYARALLKLDDHKMGIDKIDAVPDEVLNDYKAGKSRSIPVHMILKTSSGKVALSYSMIFQNERWKLRNIIVDGINIGIQFRNQFAKAMGQHNDIQYVVDHWPELMSDAIGGKSTEDKKK